MSERYLNVDPTLCVGHGLCAEILPEVIGLDDWSYPIIASGPLPPWLRRQGARARAACPALALSLDRQPRRQVPRPAGGHPLGTGFGVAP